MNKTFNKEAFLRICEPGYKYREEKEKAIKDPKKAQTDFLMNLLSDNKDTEYGKKYDFANITSYEEFASKVPITEYDDYLPYIDRMIDNNETDLITSYPVIHYAASSGSTGIPKRIPASVNGIEFFASSMRIVLSFLDEEIQRQNHEYGPVCFLPDYYWDYIDDNTTYGSISAQSAYGIKEDFLSISTSPEELQYPNEHSVGMPYAKAIFALINRDLTCIMSTFSSVAYEFLHLIETYKDSMIDDIRNGKLSDDVMISDKLRETLNSYLEPNPTRADELEAALNQPDKSGFVRRIWPNMSMYIFIGASVFAEYTNRIRLLSNDIPIHMLSYAASESLFAMPLKLNEATYCPEVSNVFFEFRSIDGDDEGTIYLIDELEVDRQYELIITNMSGFYRYRMFDVFKIDRHEGTCPIGHISFRLNQMVNMVGEHVSTEDIEYVVEGLSKADNITTNEYALYEDYTTTPGRYIILVEPDADVGKGVQDKLTSVSDDLFKKANRSYNKYRDQNTLGAPQIIYLEPYSFRLYKELQIASGISPNQIKPVRLIDNRKKKEFFFGLSEGPYKATKRVLADAERELESMELLKAERAKLKAKIEELTKEIEVLKSERD